jgi:hypothetical protein
MPDEFTIESRTVEGDQGPSGPTSSPLHFHGPKTARPPPLVDGAGLWKRKGSGVCDDADGRSSQLRRA